ncbi:putative glucarate transporter [Bacteroidales bacterium CF]|nr:putative glucarate transporter [Bacteroidales bacterium CF]
MNTIKVKKDNYKWEVLVLLWIAFFVNQADRQVFNVVLPLIKEDLALSDVQIGTIATAFNLVYALLVPMAGYIGDLFSRKWIVSLSILFWSVATMFTGLSNGMIMLIVMRSVATGGGEAFFGPSNYALLASYHRETRSFAMSIHQTSYYVGVILSGFVAGYIGQHYGWRSAFLVFGAVGVIHAVVMIFRLKDKREKGIVNSEGVNSENVKSEKISLFEGFRVLFTTPTAVMLTIGFSGLIFVLTGYLTWMPTYLYEEFNMSLAEAGFHSMFYTHLFAFFGVMIAGKLSDKLAGKNPANRILLQAGGLLFAVPFIILMGNSGTLAAIYVGFAGFGFARAFFDANTYTVLYDVIPEKYHSSASGVMIMLGFAVGSLSPLILGLMKPVLGLSFSISSLAVIWLVCGLLMVVAYKFFYNRDYAKIHNI